MVCHKAMQIGVIRPQTRWALFFLSLFLMTGVSGAREVVVRALIAESPEAGPQLEGELEASPVMQSGASSEEPQKPLSRPMTIPGEATVDLPEGSSWRLSLQAGDAYWSPETLVEAGREDVILRLYPTGTVMGRLAVSDGDEPPANLTARFDRVKAPAGKAAQRQPVEELEGQVACRVEGSDWLCRIPVGTLHLRLRAEGFVPHYFWDVGVTLEKPSDLGLLKLARGSSIAGWVATEDELPLGEGAEVEARPRVSRQSKPELERKVRGLRITERVGDRGFFQIAGLQPGAYAVTATREGYSPEERSVVVTPDSETELNDPLVLKRPLDVEIRIDPRIDLTRKGWRIQLMTMDFKTVGSGIAELDGTWKAPGLSAGRYRVWIANSDAERMALEEIVVTPQDTHFDIELSMIWVEGTVTLGDEDPIPATVTFGGISGVVAVTMEADDEGRFSGRLPRSGDWRVDVELEDPPIFRRYAKVPVEPEHGVAEVELKLPDTLMEGEVVRSDGRPVPDAQLLIVRMPATDPPTSATTDEEGRFALYGNEPGDYRLEARCRTESEATLAGAPVDVHLNDESSTASVRLVVDEMTVLRGRVVSDTSSVPGAQVQVTSTRGATLPGMLVPEVRSDADGSFKLEVPAGLTEVELLVLAPGFVLKSFRLEPEASSEGLILPLDQAGGGEIAITLTPGVESGRFVPDQVYLVKDGVLRFDQVMLVRWARENGFPAEPTRIVVPGMPAGSYSACWPRPGKRSGKVEVVKTGWKCSEAILFPGQRVDLDPPGEQDHQDDHSTGSR